MDGAMVGFPPNPHKILKKNNIIIYMSSNFSNFVLENYTFAPFKLSLIILIALLWSQIFL